MKPNGSVYVKSRNLLGQLAVTVLGQTFPPPCTKSEPGCEMWQRQAAKSFKQVKQTQPNNPVWHTAN